MIHSKHKVIISHASVNSITHTDIIIYGLAYKLVGCTIIPPQAFHGISTTRTFCISVPCTHLSIQKSEIFFTICLNNLRDNILLIPIIAVIMPTSSPVAIRIHYSWHNISHPQTLKTTLAFRKKRPHNS